MSSGYISQLSLTETSNDEIANFKRLIAQEILTLPNSELPLQAMIHVVGSHNSSHYKNTSVEYFMDISHRLGIQPDMKVIDIGCGCGRIAMPFARYLRDGFLWGCDAWPEGILWCKARLSGPNAEFELMDAKNNYYFDPLNEEVSNIFKLHWIPDGELDAAYAVSVFTHLVRRDAQQYLNELGRALRSGGLVYATFFLMDRYFWRYRDATGNHESVSEQEPGCYHAYSGQDFFAGFTMGVLQEMFAEAGLNIVCYELGSWARKPGGRSYQDVFILEKH